MSITHSILRYLVLLFGIYAITKSYRGMKKGQDYTKTHNLSAVLFVATMHLQVLIGLAMYFMKGWHERIGTAFANMGDTLVRFFAVEHIFGMLVAAVLIQMGRTKSKKATETSEKHRIAFRYFVIAMIIILVTIPWPFREVLNKTWLP